MQSVMLLTGIVVPLALQVLPVLTIEGIHTRYNAQKPSIDQTYTPVWVLALDVLCVFCLEYVS